MIVFALRVTTNPDSRTEVLQNLTSLLVPTRVQPGCISCRLYADIEEPKAIRLVEEWQSQAELERHLRSEDFRLILAAIELSAGRPELHFDTVSARGGLEVIESARLQSGSPSHVS